MDRTTLIQHLIDKNQYSNYLEIGVFKGATFFKVKCKNKIAVDPFFQFSRLEKLKWYFKNPGNFKNRYFELKSDDFFHEEMKTNNHLNPDIVFIDGLHTYEASLRDVLNSLTYLSEKGTIVMHDCFPPNSAAAYPADSYQHARSLKLEGWTGEWCGDVWKTIVYLKKRYSKELDIQVLNSDYGLGVINFREISKLNLEKDGALFEEIDNLTFDNLRCNPQSRIGLKDPKEFKSFIDKKK
ncbi:class I SAM-dependent methyltransferase [Salegentibacter sp. F188]|uniref:Class I SAM-dependent methyltransferase n=1 Tax=Autumnicola patrickiae TaxID=3075591 RepID=A0ABU3DY02_9FLAO|nr:class I SAM-dependent methyltransferase [Salegentibacter sp. F188]MDT0688610.1 class I SAM-dependent methyltransferase [Salegentibacter sp. F188]